MRHVAVILLLLGACAPSTRPSATSSEPDDALVSLASSADLTEHWPCGLGFALSDREQQVAVHIYPASAPEDVPESLPAEGWTATVRVGEHLMANHCDDVVEPYEPVPSALVEWPLAAESFTFESPSGWPSPECGATVTAELVGATAETPSGPVDLGDLTITNEAFGCFAG